jgi:hypothetical protein
MTGVLIYLFGLLAALALVLVVLYRVLAREKDPHAHDSARSSGAGRDPRSPPGR